MFPYWSVELRNWFRSYLEGNWVNPQIKDHFYDQFLKEPTKDNFRDFMKKSCGELNEMDFKETWIDKGPLAKIMLAMANNGGGIIIFGVKENEDNTFDVLGLDNLKDTADISNSISRLVSSSLDYEVFNFVFDSVVYCTEIQVLDSTALDKNGFLPKRDLYSYQLKNYLEYDLKKPDYTCMIYFSENKKKLEKEAVKVKAKYKKSTMVLQAITSDKFSFKKPEE